MLRGILSLFITVVIITAAVIFTVRIFGNTADANKNKLGNRVATNYNQQTADANKNKLGDRVRSDYNQQSNIPQNYSHQQQNAGARVR